FELDNGALELALVIAIIRGVRVMREHGPRQTEQQENDGERRPVHAHCSAAAATVKRYFGRPMKPWAIMSILYIALALFLTPSGVLYSVPSGLLMPAPLA